MRKAGTSLIFAYAGSFITLLYVLCTLAFNSYGLVAESGTGMIAVIPYLMALMGLSGLFFSALYLYKKILTDPVLKKQVIDAVVVVPAVFMACLQLYAFCMFMAWL
ncbi:MAG: hypothetical protein K0S33_3064 [Bacteroidetes bacterium]|jgi:hypothetical protein|nr:hypothetical protein [Bacteroidota bacterium]